MSTKGNGAEGSADDEREKQNSLHQKYLEIKREHSLRTSEGLRRIAEGHGQVASAVVEYYDQMIELQKRGFLPPPGALQLPAQWGIPPFLSAHMVLPPMMVAPTNHPPAINNRPSSARASSRVPTGTNNPESKETSDGTTPKVPPKPPSMSSSSSSSDSETDEADDGTPTDRHIWPDGTCQYVASAKQIKPTGAVNIGWAFYMLQTNKNKNGVIARKSYCLGTMECPTKGCPFSLRPMNPPFNKLGMPPRPHRKACPRHPDRPLKWVPCTGGELATARQRNIEGGNPCIIIQTHKPGNGSAKVEHYGTHNHRRPPANKASPLSLKRMEKMVLENPIKKKGRSTGND
ncbi:expressed unknown protein [Seminavis robusta]|uniref:Uncharacterized protein n=1 Tax=Seminavis robusta TaxID=568900 RepID=A0A9N8HRS0_9STRA|nr:expressed unknown protein [Seminavis robusta]|eukprot:Sro1353_g265370.1 n/a (346) ;mRNA; f:8838-9875